jgi:hypothetical protein
LDRVALRPAVIPSIDLFIPIGIDRRLSLCYGFDDCVCAYDVFDVPQKARLIRVRGFGRHE